MTRIFNEEKVPCPGADAPAFPETLLPIDLDIGCGVGLHIMRRAQTYNERFIIGIEHTAEKYQKFQNRSTNHNHLSNFLGVHANAISWIVHKVPPASVEQVFFMYPNPNPKASQANKRWHNMSFIGFLLTRLKANGKIMLVTNEEWYAAEAVEVLTKNRALSLSHCRNIDSKDYPVARTHFEKKYFERGESCFEVLFEKNKQLD